MTLAVHRVAGGAFETIRVDGGFALSISRHLVRLARSIDQLGFGPLDVEAVRYDVEQMLAATLLTTTLLTTTTRDARLRVTALAVGSRLHTVLSVGPLGTWPPATRLVTVPWTRNERSAVRGAKALGAADAVVARSMAVERGGDEALLIDSRGRVSEGVSSNLFAVIDDRLVTPSLDAGALGGITREVLLEITETTETDLTLDDLVTATEVFLTSSTRLIQPVSAIDDWTVPTVDGEQTMAASAAYRRLLAAKPDA